MYMHCARTHQMATGAAADDSAPHTCSRLPDAVRWLSSVTWSLFVMQVLTTSSIRSPSKCRILTHLSTQIIRQASWKWAAVVLLLHHSASLVAQAKDYVLLFRHQRWKETSEGRWHIPVSSHTVVFKGIIPYAAYENNPVFIGRTAAQLLPKLTGWGFWKSVFKSLSLLPYSEPP